jgi:hypothetical protein
MHFSSLSGFDDIPHPEDELMLDPPELSKWEKWEKDEDPYDLSPQPSKAKEKWKPGKQTFLPRFEAYFLCIYVFKSLLSHPI